MGNAFPKKMKAQILCVGLDNSGKSTIINTLKPTKEQLKELNPTVGFQAEQFTFNSILFTVFDMSGQNRYRSLWEYYFDVCFGSHNCKKNF
ncbi:hypothetical protein RFI_11211 [Reticulomyxa filosa]|uniref:Uncharacterized protein n=1 Tax=Reticulomyxa filosa TaxID=46433 RepID=X6NJN7_RETFI|nr:hypothetical protein RFI_11211 [Reticulomyxa filosa]|eukprot:ETO25924.1 hypothetical protein RFI_11211 [Reticulomyxa filosa]